MSLKDNVGICIEFSIIVLIVILLILAKGCKTDEPTEENANLGVSESPTAIVTPSPAIYRAPLTETCTIEPTATPSPSPTPIPGTTKPVEAGHKFKPYTRYTAYNIPSSQQYKLQLIAQTAENGIRVVLDPNGEWRYCVALGTYWAGGFPQHIGRCFDVYMVSGCVLKCVLADVKRTEDTKDKANRYGAGNNDVLEFIVDGAKISPDVKYYGNVSKAGAEFIGDVKEMVIFDMWIEGFGG